MKRTLTKLLLMFVLLSLGGALSGCALRERRLQNEASPVQPQEQQSRPVVPAEDGAAQAGETAAPAGIPAGGLPTTQPGAAADESVQLDAGDQALENQLLDVIGALDAANQAGDPLDDLP